MTTTSTGARGPTAMAAAFLMAVLLAFHWASPSPPVQRAAELFQLACVLGAAALCLRAARGGQG
ncbi:MAG TPA: hypothetical protein VFO85_11880, partial [Vicinamibacteria bacterium]|nr:hypothetical protein [Vicinamibacteria bacterium]